MHRNSYPTPQPARPKERQPDIGQYEITSQFGEGTVGGFHWVDSKPANYQKENESTWTGERTGTSELRDAIAEVAVNLPEVGREVPGKWQRLWEDCELGSIVDDLG